MSDWIQPSESEREEMAHYTGIAMEVEREEAEARAAERLTFTAEVTVKSQTNFFMGFSENISEGGLFLATLSPPAVGEEITLFVKTLSGTDVAVRGEVRWHRTNGRGMSTGCGVQFIGLDHRARVAFEELMRQLRKEPLFFEL